MAPKGIVENADPKWSVQKTVRVPAGCAGYGTRRECIV